MLWRLVHLRTTSYLDNESTKMIIEILVPGGSRTKATEDDDVDAKASTTENTKPQSPMPSVGFGAKTTTGLALITAKPQTWRSDISRSYSKPPAIGVPRSGVAGICYGALAC